MEIIEILEAKEDSIIMSHLSESIAQHKVTSICDYGCGDGRLLGKLHERFPDLVNLAGIDSWSDETCIREKPVEGTIEYIDNTSEEFIGFLHKSSFDLVFSTFALHHFQFPMQELKRMEALLAPGGELVLIDMYRDYRDVESIVDNVSFYNNQMLISSLKGLFHRIPYTREEVADLLLALDVVLIDQSIADLDLTEEEVKLFKSEMPKRREASAREQRLKDQQSGLNPVFLDVQERIHQMVAEFCQKYETKPDDLLITRARKVL